MVTLSQQSITCMELANGKRHNNVAVKYGDAEVMLKDVNGRHVKGVLKDALFIPFYPQDIFFLLKQLLQMELK